MPILEAQDTGEGKITLAGSEEGEVREVLRLGMLCCCYAGRGLGRF